MLPGGELAEIVVYASDLQQSDLSELEFIGRPGFAQWQAAWGFQ